MTSQGTECLGRPGPTLSFVSLVLGSPRPCISCFSLGVPAGLSLAGLGGSRLRSLSVSSSPEVGRPLCPESLGGPPLLAFALAILPSSRGLDSSLRGRCSVLLLRALSLGPAKMPHPSLGGQLKSPGGRLGSPRLGTLALPHPWMALS